MQAQESIVSCSRKRRPAAKNAKFQANNKHKKVPLQRRGTFCFFAEIAYFAIAVSAAAVSAGIVAEAAAAASAAACSAAAIESCAAFSVAAFSSALGPHA